jgi:hypothetical protein
MKVPSKLVADSVEGSVAGLGKSIEAMTERLVQALTDHANAMERAAKASEKHAQGLKHATWALVGATGGLLLATLLQLR